MLQPWIRIGQPLEDVVDDYERIFDAWEDGGVRGLVVGRMFFMQDGGDTVPAFPQDPAAYRQLGLEPPEPEARDEDKERRLSAMLDDAKKRDWHIMVFNSGTTAHVQSLINRYPQVDGCIIDGPGENHYELAWHGGLLFKDVQHRYISGNSFSEEARPMKQVPTLVRPQTPEVSIATGTE